MASSDGMQDYLINWNAGPLGVVLRPDLGADMPPVVAQLLPQPSVLKMAGVREGDLLISVNGKKTTRLGYEKVVRLLFKERLPMVLHFRSPLQELQRGVAGPIAEEPASARGRRTSNARAPQPAGRSRGRSDVDAQPAGRPRGRSDERALQIEQRRNPNSQNLSVESDKSSKSHKKSRKKSKHRDKAEAEERRLRKQFSVVWERGSLGISFRAYNNKVNVPCVDFISASRGQGRGMDRVCVNDVLIAINGEKTKALGVEKVLRWLHVIEKPVVLRFHASSNRVVNPAGGLLPHLADEERPRRPTMPHAQPEFEPAPRPPRRNNSVDQRMERGYSEDREYELQPAVARSEKRRYSRDSATYFEKQPVDEFEPQYQLAASNVEVKERRYSNNSMNAYARGRKNEEGVAGDFRREPMDDAPQFDLRIDAHIVPHRRPTFEDASRLSQSQQQAQLLPPRSRTSSVSREDIRRQQHHGQEESKAAPLVTPHESPARARLASRDSQVSNSSHLSFEEAAGVVARATGKPKEECEFGGVPLLDIKEGTVQAKLMYIYAKACLAKEGSSDDESASKDHQPPRTAGNPLGRKTHAKYLSYTILQDDHAASNHLTSETNGDSMHASHGDKLEEEEELKIEEMEHLDNGVELKNGGVFSHNLDESFAKMQKDISIQPPIVTPPLSSAGHSSSVSSDTTPAPTTPLLPADDFISLKDFIANGGSLTTSTFNSTATPVLPTHESDVEKAVEYLEKEPTSIETPEDDFIEVNGEAAVEEVISSEVMALDVEELDESESVVSVEKEADELPKVIELEDEHIEEQLAEVPPTAIELGDDHTEERQSEEQSKVIELEDDHAEYDDEHTEEPPNVIELEDVHDEQEDVHAEDDVASIGSSNERDLAASVISLDDLLDLGHHHDEEHEDFDDDDEEENDKIHSDEKEAMNTSLGMKLDQVQEEEASETEEHEVHDEPMVHETHEEENEVFDDGALTNPIVDELFSLVPDVREVIKDKPAIVVLVKKTMIDEIQEILQSLQMELQFERHSTMAHGSSAIPLENSQNGRDTEGKHCDRCGATGELAELDVAGRHGELYCQDCWELFFFNEDLESPVVRTSKTLAPSETSRLTADEDALDEALKYSFHDSTITREDIIHPWRYRQGSDSMSSSIRDSDASSITDRADEVWL